MRAVYVFLTLAAVLAMPQTRSCLAPNAKARDSVHGLRLESPYVSRTRVFRGQTHAHSTRSDGRQSPAKVVAFYRDAGYDFVSVSDHRVITPNPGVPGILFLPGIEENDIFADGNFDVRHENRTGATELIKRPRPPQSVFERAAAEESFAVINHPNWPGNYPQNPGWTDAQLLAAQGYHAVEVWNASIAISAEARADMLLSAGRRLDLVASDDCHDVHKASCATTWLGVFADELTASAVLASLRGGNYYSSSGAVISSVTTNDASITVSVPVASRIEFIVKNGVVAKTQEGTLVSTYTARPSDLYVRVRVTKDRSRRAWTNPIYVVPEAAP